MLDFIEEMGLENWNNLGIVLKAGITETQAENMLNHEKENKKRNAFAIRLHQRLVKLRNARERAQIDEICPKHYNRVKAE